MPRTVGRQVVEALVGTPYAEMDCFGLVREVYLQDVGVQLPTSPSELGQLFGEVWWCETEERMEEIVQPCDLLVIATRSDGIGRHVGVAIDHAHFLHTREKMGTCIEPIPRWTSKIVQVLRYRPGLP